MSLLALTLLVLLGFSRAPIPLLPALPTLLLSFLLFGTPTPVPSASLPARDTDVTALRTVDLTVGTGRAAQAGDTLTVHYTGTLLSGRRFDSSYDRGEPFDFPLGAGQVIAGWDQGLVGMRVGGKRRLVIPARLAYGEQGVGNDIPPDSALVFDVELLKISR